MFEILKRKEYIMLAVQIKKIECERGSDIGDCESLQEGIYDKEGTSFCNMDWSVFRVDNHEKFKKFM